MYVINPAPASQDLQPTASSYVTAHRPNSPESIELQQQQHKEILSQILTKCNADMSEQVANFSCPDEKTPPRSTAAVVKEGAKQHSPSSTPRARPKDSSPCTDEQQLHSLKQNTEPSKETSRSPVGERDAGRQGSTADGDVRSPSATFKRSTSPDASPLSTASSSNAASLSPESSDGPAKPSPKSEQLTESLAPASNFASVVHPKERALKSIAAAAASNERNNASANGGSSTTGSKTSTKFPGTGRTMSNGVTSSPFPPVTTTVGTSTASGGRLQFFKDGKFILELARAREGEKTNWISVPRKTYWPPTVSSTSASFHKHESSTSLSFSDDNSSIQSSPWQRDHCWKQSNPRPNISKELSLYYFRPLKARVRPPSQDTRLRWRRKRRRPYESSFPAEAASKVPTNLSNGLEVVENGKSETRKKESKLSTDGNGEVAPESHSEEMSNGTATPMDTSEVAPASEDVERSDSQQPNPEEDRPQSNGHHLPPNGTHLRASHRRKRPEGKDLISIIQTLIEQQQTKVSNSLTSSAAVGPFRLGTIAERGNNGGSSFRSSVFASSAASQHVSPRKRILRELEKVSLDDVGSSGTSSTKRSRPKSGSAAGTPVIVTATTATPLSTLPTNGTGSPLNGGTATSHGSSSSSSKASGHLNGSGSIANGTAGGTGKQSMNGAGSSLSPASKTAPTAPAPVSKPFSSYSITSLLGHNSTSTNSGESSSSAHAASFDAVQRKTDASVASVTSTASHHHYHHSQHPLSPHHHQYQGLTVGSKSPVMTDSSHHHAHYQGQLGGGSNRYGAGYSTKKRSPSYGGGNGTAASPGATSSAGSGSVDPYGNTIRSPDLSPSPEHHHTHQQHSHHSAHHHTPGSVSNSGGGGGFSRYRQHPYGGSPSSYSSAPSSSRFSPSPSTNDSATTPPYSGSGARSALSYRTAHQLGGSGSQGHSPPASNGSPQHYSRASPLNFGRAAQHSSPPPPQHSRNAGTSSSPRASPNGGVTTSHATTPTSAMASLTTGVSPSSTIRTVPKKTAALRQPFAGGHSPSSSSPSRERSNSNASSSSVKKEPEGSDSVDGPSLSHYGGPPSTSPAGVIRPNTMIASPTAHHPVANPFYPLYPTQLAAASSASPSMNPSVVAAAAAAAASSVPFHPASLSYYQHMYNAATMAFRSPLWMHYPGLSVPHAPHVVQSPHHLPPSSSAPPTIPLADRQRMIDRSAAPSPPPAPPASLASIKAEPTDSQRLQHSILATPSTTAAAALNYSVTALSASSRDILNNGGSAFSSPGGSNWPTDAVGYQHHPDHISHSAVGASGVVSATAKDEPSNDVPLNLSKH
ncbi:protein hairless isoform X2 [Anopheles stephensi]|uniref:protein hairless isoform X2 n=1 Tax=Anopheles stephensi TaxID=30069 RepID=UPI00165887E5|nr:protein hairless isoform X2 [Anopheles stephensi]